jgi:hypothetical protein
MIVEKLSIQNLHIVEFFHKKLDKADGGMPKLDLWKGIPFNNCIYHGQTSDR